MTALILLVCLGFGAIAAIQILGVMATRVDDSHRFVRLIVDTRRIRRQFAVPLDAAKQEAPARAGARGPNHGPDEVWPESL